ncbi:MAG: hypothetical protein V9E91_14035 [Burkholderiaceae bacterium]
MATPNYGFEKRQKELAKKKKKRKSSNRSLSAKQAIHLIKTQLTKLQRMVHQHPTLPMWGDAIFLSVQRLSQFCHRLIGTVTQSD